MNEVQNIEEAKEDQPETKQATELTPEQKLELSINNELRFAEETIIRALRASIQNISQLILKATTPQQ